MGIILTTNGKIYVWGDAAKSPMGNLYGLVTTPQPLDFSNPIGTNNISKLYGGYAGYGAIDTSGKIINWGSTTEIGTYNQSRVPNSPFKASNRFGYWDTLQVSSMSIGNNFMVALDTTGVAWGQSMGNDTYGYGNATNGLYAFGKITGQPAGETDFRYKKVASGDCATLLIGSDDRLYAMGRNSAYGNIPLTTLVPGNSTGTYTPTLFDVGVLNGLTFKDIALASAFAGYAISTAGDLYAWGSNQTYGLVGDGGTIAEGRIMPKQIITGTKFNSVVATQYGAAAISTTGVLYAWGSGTGYRRGAASTSHSSVPFAITTVARTYNGATTAAPVFAKAAVSTNMTMVLDTNGEVWGCGTSYNIGVNALSNTNCANLTLLSTTETFTDIAVHRQSGCGLTSSGQVFTWGFVPETGTKGHTNATNYSSQYFLAPRLMAPHTMLNVKTINYTDSDTINPQVTALKYIGEVFNLPTTTTARTGWTFVGFANTREKALRGEVDYAPGATYTAPLEPGEFELFVSYTRNKLPTAPTDTSIKINGGVQKIATQGQGSTALLYIDGAGKLFGLGQSSTGNYLNGTGASILAASPTPNPIMPEREFIDVSVGYNHVMAIDTDHHAFAWGSNAFGQIGDTGVNNVRITPVNCGDGREFKKIIAGVQYNVAIDMDDHLFTWGLNTSGQLGDGTTQNRISPKAILPQYTFKSIALSGNNTTYAITTDGRLFGWGNQQHNMLVSYESTAINTTYVVQPRELFPSLRFNSVSATSYEASTSNGSAAAAILNDGRLMTWGSSYQGQIGNARSAVGEFSSGFFPVPNVTFTEIQGSKFGFHARDSQGNLWAWGYSAYGEIGNGRYQNEYVPIKILSGVNVRQIAVAFQTGYYLDTNGNIWGYGLNTSYEALDGLLVNFHSPVQVSSHKPEATYADLQTAITNAVVYENARLHITDVTWLPFISALDDARDTTKVNAQSSPLVIMAARDRLVAAMGNTRSATTAVDALVMGTPILASGDTLWETASLTAYIAARTAANARNATSNYANILTYNTLYNNLVNARKNLTPNFAALDVLLGDAALTYDGGGNITGWTATTGTISTLEKTDWSATTWNRFANEVILGIRIRDAVPGVMYQDTQLSLTSGPFAWKDAVAATAANITLRQSQLILDTSTLSALRQKGINYVQSFYTPETWVVFYAALADATAFLRSNLSGVQPPAYQAVVYALDTAMRDLAVDSDDLSVLIIRLTEIKETEESSRLGGVRTFTDSSFNAIKIALVGLLAVYDNATLLFEAQTNAAGAVEGLVSVVDLNTVIAVVTALQGDPLYDTLSETNRLMLENHLDLAEVRYQSSSRAELAGHIAGYHSRIRNLVLEIGTNVLGTEMQNTRTTWDAFRAEYDAISFAIEATEFTPLTVCEYIHRIKTVVDNLQPSGNLAPLVAAIAAATRAATTDAGDYTIGSVARLFVIIGQAEEVVTERSVQSTVSAKILELTETPVSIVALRNAVNRALLEINDKYYLGYSPLTRTALETAIAGASALYNDGTQTAIDTLAAQIVAATNALTPDSSSLTNLVTVFMSQDTGSYLDPSTGIQYTGGKYKNNFVTATWTALKNTINKIGAISNPTQQQVYDAILSEQEARANLVSLLVSYDGEHGEHFQGNLYDFYTVSNQSYGNTNTLYTTSSWNGYIAARNTAATTISSGADVIAVENAFIGLKSAIDNLKSLVSMWQIGQLITYVGIINNTVLPDEVRYTANSYRAVMQHLETANALIAQYNAANSIGQPWTQAERTDEVYTLLITSVTSLMLRANATKMKELQDTYDKYIQLDESDFTRGFEGLNLALTAAAAIIEDYTNATSGIVDAARAAIAAAVDNVGVNTSKLAVLVIEMAHYDNAGFFKIGAFANFQNDYLGTSGALGKAQTVTNNPIATPDVFLDAYATLLLAKGKLVNLEYLQEQIDNFNSIDASKYKRAQYNDFKAYVQKAKSYVDVGEIGTDGQGNIGLIIDSIFVTREYVVGIVGRLSQLILNTLVDEHGNPLVDKTQALIEIEKWERFNPDGIDERNDYETDSIPPYAAACASLLVIFDSTTADQDDVDSIVTAVRMALRTNKNPLRRAVEQVDEIIAPEVKYTKTTWKDYAAARAIAEMLLGDDYNATPDEIKFARLEFLDSYDALRLKTGLDVATDWIFENLVIFAAAVAAFFLIFFVFPSMIKKHARKRANKKFINEKLKKAKEYAREALMEAQRRFARAVQERTMPAISSLRDELVIAQNRVTKFVKIRNEADRKRAKAEEKRKADAAKKAEKEAKEKADKEAKEKAEKERAEAEAVQKALDATLAKTNAPTDAPAEPKPEPKPDDKKGDKNA
jgi:alpha-tubulin suppressor-like RCC1 family protein